MAGGQSADQGGAYRPAPWRCAMSRRSASVLWVILLLVAPLVSAQSAYDVTVEVLPGEDAGVIAAQLAATYNIPLDRAAAGGSAKFVAATTEARAQLLRNDPHVLAVSAVSALETNATFGGQFYGYDGSGNITQTSWGDTYTYDTAGRVLSGTAGAAHVQEYSYDGFGNLLTVQTDGNAGAE